MISNIGQSIYMNMYILEKHILNSFYPVQKFKEFLSLEILEQHENKYLSCFLTTWYISASFLCVGNSPHLSSPYLSNLEAKSISLMSSPAVWTYMWHKVTQTDCASNSEADSPLTKVAAEVDSLWATVAKVPAITSRSSTVVGTGFCGVSCGGVLRYHLDVVSTVLPRDSMTVLISHVNPFCLKLE